MTGARPTSLAAAAAAIVAAPDPGEKVRLAQATADAWLGRRLSSGPTILAAAMPERPGRPAKPDLLPPRAMPKRSTQGAKGRIALLHSLAHIELNAVDMTWDLVGRFLHVPMPLSYLDDWVRVGSDEARHFEMVARRLANWVPPMAICRRMTACGRPHRRPATACLRASRSSPWFWRRVGSM
jgi:uncharacterized ferritin-like protein (DUF455 family)